MPTTAELDRLTALLERLGDIGAKARGELIRSAEWNELVGAVGDVARAVLGEDRVDAVPAHSHDEQVGLGWLAPRLRQLLTGGPLSDSQQLARLGKLERDLSRVARSREDLAVEVGGLRGRLTDVATRDLAREATLTTVGRRLDGIGDARDDVADVRRTLEAVQGDVQRAIAVGQQLEEAGGALDVRGLVARVDDLEQLRQRLTLPDGSLLDATEFRRQITQLETRLVTEQELDAALQTVRRRDLDPAVVDEMVVRAADRTTEQLDPRLGALETDLRREISTRFEGIDALVSSAIDAATPDITRTAVQRAEAIAAEAVAAVRTNLRDELTATVEARVTELATSVDGRLGELDAELASTVAQELGRLLPERLGEVESRLDGLAGQLATTQRLAAQAHERGLSVSTRIEQVHRDAAAARAQLLTRLEGRLDEISVRIERRMPELGDELRARITADVRGELAGMRRSLEHDLSRVAVQAAKTEVRLLRGQLDGTIRAVLGDELSASRDELVSVAEDRAARDDVRLRGMVADEVRRATADLTALVDAAVEARLPGEG